MKCTILVLVLLVGCIGSGDSSSGNPGGYDVDGVESESSDTVVYPADDFVDGMAGMEGAGAGGAMDESPGDAGGAGAGGIGAVARPDSGTAGDGGSETTAPEVGGYRAPCDSDSDCADQDDHTGYCSALTGGECIDPGKYDPLSDGEFCDYPLGLCDKDDGLECIDSACQRP